MGDRQKIDRRRREFAKRQPTHYCPRCSAVLYPEDEACLDCEAEAPAAGWPTIQDGFDPWLGRMLDGRYLVTKRVGHGATGAVYRVESLGIVREFAVKIINFKQAQAGVDSEQIRGRLQREIEAISRLRNPHVVPFYEVLELFDNFLGVVMDFVDGDTLEVLVRRNGPLDPQRACRILRQVANGVHEAHEVGMIHRDLKPENAMLEVMPAGDDFVHVLDFGIVRLDDGVSMTRGFLGTPLYASPEQATASEIDRRSDIYSLGAVLFFLLTGRPPFVSDNVYEILRAHVRQAPPKLADVLPRRFPQELEDLVASMLAKSPADRPQSLSDVIRRLDDLLYSGILTNSAAWGKNAGSTESVDLPFIGKTTHEESPYDDSEAEFQHEPNTRPLLARSGSYSVTQERDGTGPKAAILRKTGSRTGLQKALSEEKAQQSQYDRVRKTNTGVFAMGTRIPDGISLCRTGRDKRVAVVDGRNAIHVGEGTHLERLAEEDVKVGGLAIAPNGVVVGRADGTIGWRAFKGASTHLFTAPGASPITAVASDPAGGVFLAGTEGGSVYVCRPQRGLEAWTKIQDGPPISAVALDSQGNMFAVARKTREVEVFHVNSPRTALAKFSTSANITQVSFSTDGHLISVLTTDNAVTLHQSLTGVRIMAIKDEINTFVSVGFNEQNELLGYVAIDGTLFGVDLQRELIRAGN